MGFCFGGGMVWRLLAAGESRVAAAAPFYGPFPDERRPGPGQGGGPRHLRRPRRARRRDAAPPPARRSEGRALKHHLARVHSRPTTRSSTTREPRFNPPAAAEANRRVLDWFDRYAAYSGRSRHTPAHTAAADHRRHDRAHPPRPGPSLRRPGAASHGSGLRRGADPVQRDDRPPPGRDRPGASRPPTSRPRSAPRARPACRSRSAAAGTPSRACRSATAASSATCAGWAPSTPTPPGASRAPAAGRRGPRSTARPRPTAWPPWAGACRARASPASRSAAARAGSSAVSAWRATASRRSSSSRPAARSSRRARTTTPTSSGRSTAAAATSGSRRR